MAVKEGGGGEDKIYKSGSSSSSSSVSKNLRIYLRSSLDLISSSRCVQADYVCTYSNQNPIIWSDSSPSSEMEGGGSQFYTITKFLLFCRCFAV